MGKVRRKRINITELEDKEFAQNKKRNKIRWSEYPGLINNWISSRKTKKK
jgi:hypothetical protein